MKRLLTGLALMASLAGCNRGEKIAEKLGPLEEDAARICSSYTVSDGYDVTVVDGYWNDTRFSEKVAEADQLLRAGDCESGKVYWVCVLNDEITRFENHGFRCGNQYYSASGKLDR